ncbi:MAG TPA: alginate lyase family protein [Ktedonobacteraceae bacterium]|nr:alginate lyase family protein [Ktedonobacteraceae bacterium]
MPNQSIVAIEQPEKKYRVVGIIILVGLACFMLGACGGVNNPATTQVATPLAQNNVPRVFLLDPAVLQQTKQALGHDTTLQASLQQLTQQADKLLSARTVSVVEKTQALPDIDKHDYLSLADYYWPDPSKSDGLPYIQRDGQLNPEVNTIPDKSNYNKMASSVRTLGFAYYFTGKEAYAAKAADFLRVWFLNKDTYMNPNLNHAQMIRGRDTGRSIGIIDVRDFASIVDAIGLIQHSHSWTEQDQNGIERWFSQYLDWLLNSTPGKEEAAASNNHGTWYDEQAASIALFVNKTDVARSIIETSETRRIQKQIQADGSQPQELKRTLSWHYSTFNLDALFRLASLGDRVGINLWNYTSPQGAGLRKALDYIVPAAQDPTKWTYQQISPIKPGELVDVLYRAAAHYHETSYLQTAQAILGNNARTNLDNLIYGSDTSKQ